MISILILTLLKLDYQPDQLIREDAQHNECAEENDVHAHIAMSFCIVVVYLVKLIDIVFVHIHDINITSFHLCFWLK